MDNQKQKLHDYIKSNPGKSIVEIGKALGLRVRVIRDVLIEMVRSEELRVEKGKNKKFLYHVSSPSDVKVISQKVVKIESYKPISTLHRVREIKSVFDRE